MVKNHLATQGTLVRSLVWGDPTCVGHPSLLSAMTAEPTSCND